MDIVYSSECLKYKKSGHVESPQRIEKAYKLLNAEGFNFISPDIAGEEDLLLVHDKGLIERVKNNTFFDYDSPNYKNIYRYALLAAGGALKAMQIGGFSLMRPPGHHAGRSFLGGFCYFNNLAVAVKKSGLKTLIIDFDGHHGNGTEDIFFGDSQVDFISLHRSGIFPRTGNFSEQNIFNFPLQSSCGDVLYLKTLNNALDVVSDRKYEQLAVSAGFDSHINDQMASLGLTASVYKEIGKILSGLNIPAFAVLEGGYMGEDLSKNILYFLHGFNKFR